MKNKKIILLSLLTSITINYLIANQTTQKTRGLLCEYTNYVISSLKKPPYGPKENTNVTNKTISFIFDSDQHFNAEKQINQNKKKINLLNSIIKNAKSNTQAIILSGDMTDWGYKKNWKLFENNWLKPLEKINIPILYTMGNHDWYGEDKQPKSYARKQIEKKFVQTYYRRYLGDINLISLGVSPCKKDSISPFGINQKSALKWLNKLIKKKIIGNNPIILYFHYNLLGNYSYWWSNDEEKDRNGQKERDEFFKIIKPIKDKILLIITGHYHYTYGAYWKDIPTICVGGSEYSKVFYNHKNKKLEINFISCDKNGNEKINSWDYKNAKEYNPSNVSLKEGYY